MSKRLRDFVEWASLTGQRKSEISAMSWDMLDGNEIRIPAGFCKNRRTDGPYLESKEHIGGFWILECADMDEAVAWARKGVAATRGQVEVREIFFVPAPEKD